MNKKFTSIKKVSNFDFDYYLMQRVEKIKIYKNSLRIKLSDRKSLVFNKIKLEFIDLRIFRQNNLYIHSVKNVLGKVYILFDSAEKLFDITLIMSK